jgi:GTP-binding protein
MYFLFVLVDSRLEPQRIDLEFMEMLGVEGIPFGIIFTKTDKTGVNKLASNVAAYKRRLLESWEELPPIFTTSSETGAGCQDVLDFIEQCQNQTN